MKFEFIRGGNNGLPVIPLIPSHDLSTIEGKNGIGKTLAARILELLTGNQPFAALPKAWNSLRSDLGKLTVRIDGFPSGEVVRCELDSSLWLDRTEADCAASPGDVFVNDQSVDWATFRTLLQVRRIAGDEGLSETLARTLREVSLYARERGSIASGIADAFGEELTDLLDDVAGVRTEGAVEEFALYRKTTKDVEKAKSAFDVADAEYQQSVETLHRLERLRDTLVALPQLIDDYAVAFAAQSSAEEAVRTADRTLTDLGRNQVIDAEKQKQIDWLLGRLPPRTRQLADARLEEQSLHRALGIEERLSPADVAQRIKVIKGQIAKLEEDNRSADLAGTVREVQNEVENELRSMPPTAQGERFAIVGHDIRVGELADGIARRRKQLEGVPKPDEVSARERAIHDLEIQQNRLGFLNDAYKKTDQKQALVDDGARELSELRGSASGDKEYLSADAKASGARAEFLAASLALARARAAVDSELGVVATPEPDSSGPSDDLDEAVPYVPPIGIDEIEARVSAWLVEMDIDVDAVIGSRADWRDAVRKSGGISSRIKNGLVPLERAILAGADKCKAASNSRAELEEQLSRSVSEADKARDAVRLRTERLELALRSLSDAAGPWGAYASAVDRVISRVGLSSQAFRDLCDNPPQERDVIKEKSVRGEAILKAISAVEVIAEIANEVEAATTRVRDQWSNSANYLYRFSADLSPRLDDDPYDAESMRAAAGPAMIDWAEAAVGDLLSSPELRSELFGGTSSVSFDIRDLTVTWDDPATARKRRRPIEAFSSGEQVFAYTKAKLELLRGLHEKSTYVVVFLDEFGAFVARDRFAQLVTYIEHDALGDIADQIVITIPLSGDLRQVTNNAALAKVQAELIDPPGYVVLPANLEP